MKGEFKDDTFLARWLNDQLTPQELEDFQSSEAYGQFKKIVDGSELITIPSFDEEKILSSIKENHGQKAQERSPKTRYIWLSGIAASIILVVSIIVFNIGTTPEIVTAKSEFGEKKFLLLPDGSEVVLNSKSEVTYHTGEWDEARKISLSGEAYFEVAAGETFTVDTESGEVTVLGTTFNVAVMNGFFEVKCFEGKVEVSAENEADYVLTPGKTYRKINEQPATYLTTTKNKPSWLDNESSFHSVPIKYVLIALEKQFNIKFEGSISNIDSTFTGTFPHDDLDVALKVVLGSLQIDYELKEERTVMLED